MYRYADADLWGEGNATFCNATLFADVAIVEGVVILGVVIADFDTAKKLEMRGEYKVPALGYRQLEYLVVAVVVIAENVIVIVPGVKGKQGICLGGILAIADVDGPGAAFGLMAVACADGEHVGMSGVIKGLELALENVQGCAGANFQLGLRGERATEEECYEKETVVHGDRYS